MEIAAVVGGEAVYSKNKLRKLGKDLMKSGADLENAEKFGENVSMSSQHERDNGFMMPTQIYPLFESAIRAHRHESHYDHRKRISSLWEGYNQVAATNEHAWVQTPMTAQEIMEPTPENRMVGYPYTKAMNANSFVDFGGALIICSAGAAQSLGISSDKWVFPHAATDGHATYLFSERDNFYESPAIRITSEACLELANITIDDVGPMDLYSCFPSVVQITMNELGIQPDRTTTTTTTYHRCRRSTRSMHCSVAGCPFPWPPPINYSHAHTHTHTHTHTHWVCYVRRDFPGHRLNKHTHTTTTTTHDLPCIHSYHPPIPKLRKRRNKIHGVHCCRWYSGDGVHVRNARRRGWIERHGGDDLDTDDDIDLDSYTDDASESPTTDAGASLPVPVTVRGEQQQIRSPGSRPRAWRRCPCGGPTRWGARGVHRVPTPGVAYDHGRWWWWWRWWRCRGAPALAPETGHARATAAGRG